MFEELIATISDFTNNLYNKIFRTGLLATRVFEDPTIVNNKELQFVKNKAYIQQLEKYIECCPFLLPIDTRFRLFKKIIR